MNLNYLLATIIAWIISVVFAYITNRLFVFESENKAIKDICKELISFVSSRLITGLLDLLIIYIFVDIFEFNDLVVKMASNVLVIVINYVVSKIWTFKKE